MLQYIYKYEIILIYSINFIGLKMRKVYSIIIISILFLLTFTSSLESTEVDDYFYVGDFLISKDDNHCIECEDQEYENLDLGVYYFNFNDKSIESKLSEIQNEISSNNLPWVAGYNSVFSPDSKAGQSNCLQTH